MRKAYWFTGCILAILLAGCHWALQPARSQPAAAITEATSGVTGIEAHTRSAERHVQSATPHSNSEGKLYLRAASDEHKEVLTAAVEVKTALGEATGRVQSLEAEITQAQSRYTSLESKWYVIWGRRIERALWVMGVGWLLCGIASAAFGMGNPLSLTWRIGKEITRLLPAMNMFSWIRDWLLRRREANNSYFPVSPEKPV